MVPYLERRTKDWRSARTNQKSSEVPDHLRRMVSQDCQADAVVSSRRLLVRIPRQGRLGEVVWRKLEFGRHRGGCNCRQERLPSTSSSLQSKCLMYTAFHLHLIAFHLLDPFNFRVPCRMTMLCLSLQKLIIITNLLGT